MIMPGDEVYYTDKSGHLHIGTVINELPFISYGAGYLITIRTGNKEIIKDILISELIKVEDASYLRGAL